MASTTPALVKDRPLVELVDLPSLWPSGAPGVAQAPVSLCRSDVSDLDVEGAGTEDCCGRSGVDGPGGSVGDVPGRQAWPNRQ